MDAARRERLIQLLGMTGSAFDGEAVTALRLAQKPMHDHKLDWRDLLDSPGVSTARPNGMTQALLEEKRRLLHENETLRRAIAQLARENQELRQKSAGAAKELGQNGADNHRAEARWILELYENQALALSPREHEFIETVSNWTGSLTDKQQSWFDSLLYKVIRRTGQSPP
jgi:hypothetical protein